MIDEKAQLAEAYEFMLKAFSNMVLVNENRSRELSTTITYLETAMMWLNKTRAIKGHLEKNVTHVEA